jgi:hypothetical protein
MSNPVGEDGLEPAEKLQEKAVYEVASEKGQPQRLAESYHCAGSKRLYYRGSVKVDPMHKMQYGVKMAGKTVPKRLPNVQVYLVARVALVAKQSTRGGRALSEAELLDWWCAVDPHSAPQCMWINEFKFDRDMGKDEKEWTRERMTWRSRPCLAQSGKAWGPRRSGSCQ